MRLLALNAMLRTLSLQGNPVAKLPSYRASMGSTLPALLTLDGQKMPRSSAQRQAASSKSASAAIHSAHAFSSTTTAVSRPHQPRSHLCHTRYAALDSKPSAPPALTLLPAHPTGGGGGGHAALHPPRTMANGGGATQPSNGTPRGGTGAGAAPSATVGTPRGSSALNSSLLRSSSARALHFVPTASVGGAWQQPPTSPRGSAPTSPRQSAPAAPAQKPAAAAPHSSAHQVATAAGSIAPAEAAAPAAHSGADDAPRPAAAAATGTGSSGAGGSGGRSVLRDSLGGEQKRALAAAVASKEASLAMRSTIARAKQKLHLGTHMYTSATQPPTPSDSAAHQLELWQTPVHRAPAAYRPASTSATLGTAGTVSAAAAAPTVSRLNQSGGGVAASSSGFLRRGRGIGGGGGSGVLPRRGLVRSRSAEALRPTPIVSGGVHSARPADSARSSVIPSHLTAHLSPPLMRQNSSRAAAGAATERAPASAASAEKGLMELAFEVGCGIKVRREASARALNLPTRQRRAPAARRRCMHARARARPPRSCQGVGARSARHRTLSFEGGAARPMHHPTPRGLVCCCAVCLWARCWCGAPSAQVQQGVFVPSESPATLLESLLKLEAC